MPVVRHPASWTTLRSSTVWHDLREALDRLGGGDPLRVVDAGGGSGGFAVPLAEVGHTVVVVDPSPDSLASLERRAVDSGVSERVQGRQGDLSTLPDVVDDGAADALLCHAVLEVADDPAGGLTAVRRALRAGGLLSVLTANRHAVVVARAVAGRLDVAETVLLDSDGRAGAGDRVLRRFDVGGLERLVTGSGFVVEGVHGVRVFADLVPATVLDTDPAAREALARLEAAASRMPAFRALATQLHLLAHRP